MALTIPKAIRKLLIKEPFYGLFLLSLNKYFDDTIKTACVKRNGINVELAINEKFWNSLSDEAELAVLEHEVLHLVNKHLTMQESFSNKDHFNIAADAEVNSYIENLPPDCIKAENYGLPPMCGTKFYYENIPEDKKNPPPPTLDQHDWGAFQGMSDAEKQLVENQIDHIARQTAESVQKMQGRIPSCLTEYIDSLFKKKERIFDWKAYFRRMLGTIIDIELKKTRKKESIRFPDASGLKHRKKSNICVIVDTSGSVSNQELCDFFSEIYHVWKAGASVTIIENDAAIGRIYKYDGKWDGKVTGRGGTVFDEAVQWYNDHRRDFSTVIFFTDGYADVDLPIAGESVWVITSDGCKQDYPGKTIYIPKKSN